MALRFLNSGYFAGKVGIGTESPVAKLELGANDFVMVNVGTGGRAGILFNETGTPSATNVQYGARISYRESGDVLELVTRENNVDKLGIAIARLTGYVGIGTDTSINNPLTVSKDAGGNAIAYFNSLNTNGYGVAIRTADDGNDKYILRLDSAYSSEPVMYASNAGNVGIGTDSPDTKLEVRTDSGAASANSYFRVTAGAQGAYGGAAHFEGAYNDYGNVDQPNIVGKIDMASEVVTAANVGGTMRFFTKATGGTYATAPLERMRINSDGTVGIGSNALDTAGGDMLHVDGTLRVGPYFSVSDRDFIKLVPHGSDTRIISPNERFHIENESGNIIITPASAGGVGIGTTTPNQRLQVQTATTTDSSFQGINVHNNGTTGTRAGICFQGYDWVQSAIWHGRGMTPTSESGALVLGTNPNTTDLTVSGVVARMVINNAGAIKFNAYGAGTLVTDASGNITVSSGGGAGGPYLPLAGGTMTGNIDFVNNKDISMTDNAGAVTRVMVLNTSNTMYIGPVDTYAGGSILYGVAAGVSYQRFFTGASERMRIGSNGNVAIGTTATTYRLQVEQDNDGNLLSRFHNTADNGQGLLIRAGGVSSANRVLQLASENDTKIMTVNSNGRVGIGTANPAEKLEVVGNVLITAALLSNQENTDVDTGAEVVAQVSTSTYTAAFFDFVIKKVGNIRSGTVYACHDGTNVEFTETSTQDLGDTSDVTLSVDKSGTNLRLIATVTSDDWIIKSLIRAI
jgi:hypothetical protein